jgi:hypothetical protein
MLGVFLDCARREARSEGIGRDFFVPEAMERNSEVAQFQCAVGRNEYVARCDVAMDGAAGVHHSDGAEEVNDLAARARLRPGLRIAQEVAIEVAFRHVFGDQAVDRFPAAARGPCEGVVYADQRRHVAKEMAEVCFPVPG